VANSLSDYYRFDDSGEYLAQDDVALTDIVFDTSDGTITITKPSGVDNVLLILKCRHTYRFEPGVTSLEAQGDCCTENVTGGKTVTISSE
jgi:hypothetical protein